MKRKLSIFVSLLMVLSMVFTVSGLAASYTVIEGDTLGEIATANGTTYQKLAEINDISNPSLIHVGDVIELEDAMAVEEEMAVDEFTAKDLNEHLVMSTLWVQAAAEFRAMSYQTFNLAEMLVEKDLADTTVTMPRAIVVDLDETILDNSPYEAWLVGKDFGYSSSTWNPWITEGVAPAMPGAVEFLQYCEANDVAVYYVSNRKVLDDNSGYAGTVKNLEALNLPNVDAEHVLLRTAESDKTVRRTTAETGNHVVLYMGDNLNDFLQDFSGLGVEERYALTDMYKADFGSKFIMMPNPMYGEWEWSVQEFNYGASDAEKDQMRKDALTTWDYTVD